MLVYLLFIYVIVVFLLVNGLEIIKNYYLWMFDVKKKFWGFGLCK